MGIGTYREDYGGMGRSINVASPSVTDEDYQAYLKECEESGTEPNDRGEFDKDEYDTANEGVVSIVESVAEEVGLSSVLEGRFGSRRAAFDKDIVAIAQGGVVDVGWRSWSDDFVVAIGPCRTIEDRTVVLDERTDAVGIDPAHAISLGRSPERFSAAYAALLDDFGNLLRLSLMRSGHGTSTPTSGWTSKADATPADVDGRIEALTAKVRDAVADLSRNAADTLETLPADERVELARALDGLEEGHSDDLPSLVVPAYDPGTDLVFVWATDRVRGGGFAQGSSRGLVAGWLRPPAEVSAYLATLPEVDGVVPVPAAPETEAFLVAVSRHLHDGSKVVVTAEQFAEATGRDCVIEQRVASGEMARSTLHEATPTPAPGM